MVVLAVLQQLMFNVSLLPLQHVWKGVLFYKFNNVSAVLTARFVGHRWSLVAVLTPTTQKVIVFLGISEMNFSSSCSCGPTMRMCYPCQVMELGMGRIQGQRQWCCCPCIMRGWITMHTSITLRSERQRVWEKWGGPFSRLCIRCTWVGFVYGSNVNLCHFDFVAALSFPCSKYECDMWWSHRSGTRLWLGTIWSEEWISVAWRVTLRCGSLECFIDMCTDVLSDSNMHMYSQVLSCSSRAPARRYNNHQQCYDCECLSWQLLAPICCLNLNFGNIWMAKFS